MIHDRRCDLSEDRYFVIIECTRLVVDHAIRTYNSAAETGEGNLRIAAHIWPARHVWPGAEMGVCAEVAYDIAGAVSSNVGRFNGLVRGGKDLYGLRTNAKAELESRKAKVDAVAGRMLARDKEGIGLGRLADDVLVVSIDQ
jgi:hypothetical protein